ncbi:putative ubiquitin-conjugating enzyme E2 39 isoform X2 [Wolffia australiana]
MAWIEKLSQIIILFLWKPFQKVLSYPGRSTSPEAETDDGGLWNIFSNEEKTVDEEAVDKGAIVDHKFLEFGQKSLNEKLKNIAIEDWPMKEKDEFIFAKCNESLAMKEMEAADSQTAIITSAHKTFVSDENLQGINNIYQDPMMSIEEMGNFISEETGVYFNLAKYVNDLDEYPSNDEMEESNANYNEISKLYSIDFPAGVDKAFLRFQDEKFEEGNFSNSMQDDETNSDSKEFKLFDIIVDYSDHYFFQPESQATELLKTSWVKAVQNEWRILERELPENILVRVYEERMDLMRAVIVGASGTPYHDGLFFFDCCFPPTFPDEPPNMYYHSHGLRINPNMYENGLICLSLLGTWIGEECEMWNPNSSNMLQILVSIQALVLNSTPYFNEPGFESTKCIELGCQLSEFYNQDIFLLSCITMLHSLRRPPKNFEDFVVWHFRKRGKAILTACRHYLNRVKVSGMKGDNNIANRQRLFYSRLSKLFEDLQSEFKTKGIDCSISIEEKSNPEL